ncbi:MAG TPA: hypothetical protein VHZ55_24005 [Bryobacteraceae bacterium]|nr:hypothetical protein [Bryobacteraceae bacterium]
MLNFVFQYSKLIALAAAIFLLSANLDNVPDCPELLNAGMGSTVLLVVHHAPLEFAKAMHTAWEALPRPEDYTQYVSDAVLVLSPPCVTRSVHQAADPSPPTA